MDSPDSSDVSESELDSDDGEELENEVPELAEDLQELGNGPRNEGRGRPTGKSSANSDESSDEEGDDDDDKEGVSSGPRVVWKIDIPPMQWAKTRLAQIVAGLELFMHCGFLTYDQTMDAEREATLMLGFVSGQYEKWKVHYMASSAFWCILLAQNQKYMEWNREWKISGKYEEEVDRAREIWTLQNMHLVMSGDKGKKFRDPTEGGANYTNVGSNAGKRHGFSILVYGSKEKRRRLDVRKLGNEQMQQRKVHAFCSVRDVAGLPPLPDGIKNRAKPDRHIYDKSNSAREKALERISAKMDANRDAKINDFRKRRAKMLGSGKKPNAVYEPPSLLDMERDRMLDRQRVGGIEYSDDDEPGGNGLTMVGKTREAAAPSPSRDLEPLEKVRAPSPDKFSEVVDKADFFKKLAFAPTEEPHLSQASEATDVASSALPSELSEMDVEEEEASERAQLLQLAAEAEARRERKEEKRRLKEEARRKQEAEAEAAAAEAAEKAKRAVEAAKAAADALEVEDDEDAAMQKQMAELQAQMEAKKAAKKKAAEEAAAVAEAEAAALAAPSQPSTNPPETEDDSDSESDSDDSSSDDADDADDCELSDGSVPSFKGPINEGRVVPPASGGDDSSSALESGADHDPDNTIGPEDEDFFMQNADPDQVSNAEALQNERASELANELKGSGKDISHGMRLRLQRVFKAQAKARMGKELTKTDVLDIEWYEKLQIGDDGEVFLQKKKKEVSWEQHVLRMRKDREKEQARLFRRQERDDRRAKKKALADQKLGVRKEKAEARAQKEQDRIDRRAQRDADRAARNMLYLKTQLNKHYRKDKEKAEKKRAKAEAQLERVRAMGVRTATHGIDMGDNKVKILLPNTKKKRPRPDGMGQDKGGDFEGDGESVPVGFWGRDKPEVKINFNKAGRREGTRNASKAAASCAESGASEQYPKRVKITVVPVAPVTSVTHAMDFVIAPEDHAPPELAGPDSAEYDEPDISDNASIRQRGVAPSLVASRGKWDAMFKRDSPLVAWSVAFRTWRKSHSGDTSFPEGFPELNDFFDKCKSVQVFAWIFTLYKELCDEAHAAGVIDDNNEMTQLYNHVKAECLANGHRTFWTRNPKWVDPNARKPTVHPPKRMGEKRPRVPAKDPNAPEEPKQLLKTFVLSNEQHKLIRYLVREHAFFEIFGNQDPPPKQIRVEQNLARMCRVARAAAKVSLLLKVHRKNNTSRGSPSLKRPREEDPGSPSLRAM